MFEEKTVLKDIVNYADEDVFEATFHPTRGSDEVVSFQYRYPTLEESVIGVSFVKRTADSIPGAENSLFGVQRTWVVDLIALRYVCGIATNLEWPDDVGEQWEIFLRSDILDVIENGPLGAFYHETVEAVHREYEREDAEKNRGAGIDGIIGSIKNAIDRVSDKIDEATFDEFVNALTDAGGDVGNVDPSNGFAGGDNG